MRKWKITYTFGALDEPYHMTCYIIADSSSKAQEILYLNHIDVIQFNALKFMALDIEEVQE